MEDPFVPRGLTRQGSARFVVLCSFVLLAALSRLIPHPPNFTPIGAMALFCGAHFAARRWAFALPLAAMLISDLLLQQMHGWEFRPMTVVIYGCIAVSTWLGLGLSGGEQGRVSVVGYASRSLLSAVIFFAITNFAFWALGATYPASLEGVVMCYAAAIPFFGSSLAGYAVFGALLFGGFALLSRQFEALKLMPVRILENRRR